MRNVIILIILSLLCSSCSITSKLYTTKEDITLYSSRSTDSKKITIIPKGEIVIANSGVKYKKVYYKSYIGWSYNPSLERKYDNSYSSNNYGKVNVRGYYRKDGTYVRGHSRSRSKSKSYKSKKRYKRKKTYRRKRKSYRKRKY